MLSQIFSLSALAVAGALFALASPLNDLAARVPLTCPSDRNLSLCCTNALIQSHPLFSVTGLKLDPNLYAGLNCSSITDTSECKNVTTTAGNVLPYYPLCCGGLSAIGYNCSFACGAPYSFC
ncbi:hypothetical protein BKA70DRAFT_1401669 [Coprinopsis sp. MPI-PUGE-AT-0042]|nr:hypothetical protein BKA70DRAFT_1401669 [Coprinopsis sp. MPI-PUGE-AT-0042]